MSDEQWGPWRDHDGSGCPVAVGTIVEVVGSYGGRQVGMVEEVSFDPENSQWFGKPIGPYDYIVRYRVKRPKGLTILENLIAEIPEEAEVGG